MRLIRSPKDNSNMSEAILAVPRARQRAKLPHSVAGVFLRFAHVTARTPQPNSTGDTFVYANHREEHPAPQITHLACSQPRVKGIRTSSRFVYLFCASQLCMYLRFSDLGLDRLSGNILDWIPNWTRAMINCHLIKMFEAAVWRLVRAVQLLLLLIHSPLLTHMASVCMCVIKYSFIGKRRRTRVCECSAQNAHSERRAIIIPQRNENKLGHFGGHIRLRVHVCSVLTWQFFEIRWICTHTHARTHACAQYIC